MRSFALLLLPVLLLLPCGCGKSIQSTHGGIVSLLPSLTETVRALGLGDRLTGVSRYCAQPADSAQRVNVVGDCISPNFEQIVRLKPELVLLGDMQSGLESKFKDLGIPALMLRQSRLEDVDSAFCIIGRRFHCERIADSTVKALRTRLDSLKGLCANETPKRVLFVVGRNPGALSDIYTINGQSFLSQLLRIAGGVSVFDSMRLTWCKVSVEEIIMRDPDVIIETALMGNTDHGAEIWRQLPRLSAVKTGRIHTLKEDYIFTPGPRMAETALTLFKILNPDTAGTAP